VARQWTISPEAHPRFPRARHTGVGTGFAVVNPELIGGLTTRLAERVSRTLGEKTSTLLAPLLKRIREAKSTKDLQMAAVALDGAVTPEERRRLADVVQSVKPATNCGHS
jgi:hypothetical protein